MEYWIVKDDKQCGPYTLDQLAVLELSSGTPVWRKGLADWIPYSKILEMDAAPLPKAEAVTVENITVNYGNYGTTQSQPVPAGAVLCAPTDEIPNGYVAVMTDGTPKCPPTYLVWSIIATVLFFMPLGVCGIICSAKVKSHFAAGRYEKASRMSERAALFIALSLVVFLIWMPFQVVVAMF